MTDREMVAGLIGRDDRITALFLEKYRPLFLCTIAVVFDRRVDADECVDELYLYLMRDDAAKLRSFEGRSTFECWLKKVAVRFFRDLRNAGRVIDDRSREPLLEKNGAKAAADAPAAAESRADVERLLATMKNRRYVQLIRDLVFEDREPEEVAGRMGITVANLYNIKRRALTDLSRAAMSDREKYENG